MKPEVKAKWVAALRSGEFKQATGRLRAWWGKYCCFGVLCELHRRETGDGEWRDKGGDVFYAPVSGRGLDDLGSSTVLPFEVMEWAGLSAADPVVEEHHYRVMLSTLNDGGRSFAEIADIIERAP